MIKKIESLTIIHLVQLSYSYSQRSVRLRSSLCPATEKGYILRERESKERRIFPANPLIDVVTTTPTDSPLFYNHPTKLKGVSIWKDGRRLIKQPTIC